MTHTNGVRSGDCKRKTLSFSDEQRRDSLLRTSFNRITEGFKSKPEPKSVWYETATGDVTPWRKTVEPIRAALLAAVESGNQTLIDQTLEGAREFCRELEADFVSLVPATAEESIVALAIRETECEGASNDEEISLVSHPSPTEAERAIAPLSRHLASLALLVEKCRIAARQPVMRRAV